LTAKIKEKKMAKRKFLLVILAMVLVFGFLMTSCDDDSGNGVSGGVNLTRGRWEYNHSSNVYYTFNSSTWTYYGFGSAIMSGSYKRSGNSIDLYLYGYYFATLTIVNSTTIRDEDGDYYYQNY
jgi:hypothetical protein